MYCLNYWKTFFSRYEYSSDRPLKLEQQLSKLPSYEAETWQKFYQSHVLYSHCIVSFAVPCQSNTRNSFGLYALVTFFGVYVAPK